MDDLYLMICVDTILALIIAAFLIKSLIDEDKEYVMGKEIDEIHKKYVTLCKKLETMQAVYEENKPKENDNG